MGGIQSLLVFVVVVLTVLLIVVGIQVFLMILDIRKSVKKLDAILEDTIMGGGLIRPDKLTGILTLIKNKKTLKTLGLNDAIETKESTK